MSIDTTTRETTYDEQAEKLRDATESIDDVAQDNPTIEAFLRDVEDALEDCAAIVEEEGGELTMEEFAEKVYPRGGRR